MDEFGFSPQHRAVLTAIMARGKDPDRVQYFLNRSEREIHLWLRYWPPGYRRAELGDRYERIRTSALRLHRELAFLDEMPFALNEWLQDTDQRKVKNMLFHLAMAAEKCHAKGVDGPFERSKSQDLCITLGREYYVAFKALPSANPNGHFNKFCDELQNAEGLSGVVHITRDMILQARDRLKTRITLSADIVNT